MKNIVIAVAIVFPMLASATPADKAACDARDLAVDRKACMTEMRNARASKDLTSPSAAEIATNARQRCLIFSDDAASTKSCVDRILAGKKTGDVDKGGTITEHREVVPAKK